MPATKMEIMALSYVRKFKAVIPVGAWTYIRDGEEVDAWKVPLIKGWTINPLAKECDVRNQWRKWSSYGKVPNIGVVTGQICGGYLVIDLDIDKDKGVDGYEILLDWQMETGRTLPDTWIVKTGRGGYHFWYKTDKALRGFVNEKLGVDLRADGNFVVVPPSIHRNGRRYEWEVSPKEFGECAKANDDVFSFIDFCRPTGYQFQTHASGRHGKSTMRGEGGERKMVLMPEIPDGGRHNALLSAIGTMNRLGFTDEAIEAAVRIENEAKCMPPLTETELQKEIFPAIYRWEKGVSAESWKQKDQYLKEMKSKAAQQQRFSRALASCQS